MRIRVVLAATLLIGVSSCSQHLRVEPVVPDAPGGPLAATAEPSGSSETIEVVRIVDGDTIVVALEGRRVKVRLIGVDTPETVDPRRPVGCFGREASAFVKSLLTRQRVRLEYDVDRYDRYGRTLAYVHRDDGVFVNLKLVREGYGRVMTVPPNVRHAEEFLAAERAARSENRGLWNPRACSTGDR